LKAIEGFHGKSAVALFACLKRPISPMAEAKRHYVMDARRGWDVMGLGLLRFTLRTGFLRELQAGEGI
jgi:hypothetical protein